MAMSTTDMMWTDNGQTTEPDIVSYMTDDVTYVLSIAMGCIGLLGNALVIVVIHLHTAMRKQLTSIFIINQSVIDECASFILILTVMLPDKNYDLYGTSGIVVCKVWYSHYLLWATLMTSTFNLVCITFERYMCIVHPIWHKTRVTRKRIIVVCVCVWVLLFVNKIGNTVVPSGLTALHKCDINYYWPSESGKKAFALYLVGLGLILPLLIMIYCYGRMFSVLRSRVSPADPVNSVQAGSKENKLASARKNIFKTLITVTVCFAVCWTPNEIMYTTLLLGFELDVKSWYYNASVLLVYVNCCCNPIIYVLQYKEFQKGLRKLKLRILGVAESVSIIGLTSQ